MLDIGDPSGNEFIAGGTDFIDVNSLVDRAEEKSQYFLYNQNEYADKYGYCLCTMYNTFTNISILIGRYLTESEKIAMIEERIKIRFNPKKGGFQTDATDIGRKWLQKNYPDMKYISVMIGNSDPVRKKLFTKRIPLMTTFQWNQAYNNDTHDGDLDLLEYGTPTYGHAITDFYIGNAPSFERLDNYNNHYTIKSPEDFATLIKNGVQGRSSWLFLSENQLTDRGRNRLKLMKLKITNGERPDDNATRDEVAQFVIRINPQAKLFWNELEKNRAITRSEFQKMLEVGTGKKFSAQLFSESSKNKTITRSECWTLIVSLLNI